jgi:hypothetical protein
MPADRGDDDMPGLVHQFLRARATNALGQIVTRYYRRMRALASRYLERDDLPEAFYEPDEALNSTVDRMIRLVLSGRVESIEGVDGFWRLYRKILARKVSAACDRYDAQKRGGPGARKRSRHGPFARNSSGEMARIPATGIPPDDFDLFQSNLPPADVQAISNETSEQLIDLLEQEHKVVVRMRLDGYTIPQMAAALAVSPRTINRMLETIRGIWASSDLLDGFSPEKGFRA